MSELVLPMLFGMLVWWFGTGVILVLVRAPASSHGWSLAALSVLFVGALHGIATSSADATDPGAAYFSFVCGIVVWAWLELSYLTGYLTGPNKAPCPPGAAPWRRFRLAIGTSLYHELAVIGAGLSIAALSYGQPNQVGLWTYSVLWSMRWSAKLNMFLGVRNLLEEWFPDHLRFLGSYLERRPFNPLFPVSVTVASLIAGVLLYFACTATDSFTRVASMLVFTILLLGTLEHWLLLLPWRSSALWQGLTGPLRAPPSDTDDAAVRLAVARAGVER